MSTESHGKTSQYGDFLLEWPLEEAASGHMVPTLDFSELQLVAWASHERVGELIPLFYAGLVEGADAEQVAGEKCLHSDR